MKTFICGLIFMAGNSVAYAAQDEHAIEVEQHLE